MIDLTSTFTGPDGDARTVTIRIGDVRETHPGTSNSWSCAVEIHGFSEPEMTRIRGRDWAESIEDAAKFAAIRATDKAEASGARLDPPLIPRPRSPRGEGASCRIASDEEPDEQGQT